MRRTNLYTVDGALGLGVTGRRSPDLRLEVASGRRLLLRQRHRPVLFGRAHHGNHGMHVYRTGDYVSPLPPLRADDAGRTGPSGGAAWHDRWAHRFASWLYDADAGPLHDGRWALGPRRLPPYCLRGDLTRDYPAAYLDWLGVGWNGVLPLRRLPGADAARVKAYRRQARERVLPPILLWSVSAFDGYLLLDGHCRLVAALAEEVDPAVLVLSLVADPEVERNDPTAAHAALTDRVIAQAARSGADPLRAAEALAHRFAKACAAQPEEGRTRAWPVRGGAPAWEQQVASAAGAWATTVRG
ncbi:hypothetical protein ACGF7U_07835 [Micromonospora sp. NPDC047670]|uniref:hypothetical protein n=1 Tax=Micromonospora sp. NPDC047670 TaxID=3364252 RepID=UPI0037199EB8